MREPGNSVLRIIYDKIMGEQVKRLEEARNPRVIYVTDLVSCTHRFHLRTQYPELTLVFEPSAVLGNVAHWGVEALLREKGIDVEVEVSRTISVDGVEYVVKGRLDAVDKASGTVIEIKTARSAVNLPKEHHVKQLNIYLSLTGLDRGVLVYITPDKVVEYSFSREPVDLESEVRDLVEDRRHPRYAWECAYCIYKKLCPYYTVGEQKRS